MNRYARRTSWWTICAAFTLSVVALWQLTSLLVPREPLSTVGSIWIVSIVVLIGSAIKSGYDARRLGREWKAIDAAGRATKEELAWGPTSNTLVGLRAQRVVGLIREEQRDAPQLRSDLRSEAAAMMASIGSVPRFASTTLLLLAVLGTFAGMKTALPKLASAIGRAGVEGSSIQSALDTIASAFGANFLALFGALLLALIAFGIGAERRQLLLALEQVSEAKLYSQLPAGADASLLERAVRDLRVSARAVEGVGEAIKDLELTLHSFERALVNAIGELQSSFSFSLQQQLASNRDELKLSMQGVTAEVAKVSEALGYTATAYEGLVKGLEERDLGVRQAAKALEDVGRTLPPELAKLTGRMTDAAVELVKAKTELMAQQREAHARAADVLERNAEVSERVLQMVNAQAAASEVAADRLEAMRRTSEQLLLGISALNSAIEEVRSSVVGRLDALEQAEAVSLGRLGETLVAAVEQEGNRTRENHRGALDVIDKRTADISAQVARRADALRDELRQAFRDVRETLNAFRAAIEAEIRGLRSIAKDAPSKRPTATPVKGGHPRKQARPLVAPPGGTNPTDPHEQSARTETIVARLAVGIVRALRRTAARATGLRPWPRTDR